MKILLEFQDNTCQLRVSKFSSCTTGVNHCVSVPNYKLYLWIDPALHDVDNYVMIYKKGHIYMLIACTCPNDICVFKYSDM